MRSALHADTIQDIDALTQHKPLFGREGTISSPLKRLFSGPSGARETQQDFAEWTSSSPEPEADDTRPIVPFVDVVVAVLDGPGDAASEAGAGAGDEVPTRVVGFTQPVADRTAVAPSKVSPGPSDDATTGSTAARMDFDSVATRILVTEPRLPASSAAVAETEPLVDPVGVARPIEHDETPTQIVSTEAAAFADARATAQSDDDVPLARPAHEAPVPDAVSLARPIEFDETPTQIVSTEAAAFADAAQPTLLLFAPCEPQSVNAGHGWREAIPECAGEPYSVPKAAFAAGEPNAVAADPWALEHDQTPIAPEVRHILDADVRPVELVPDFVEQPSLSSRLARFVSRAFGNGKRGRGRGAGAIGAVAASIRRGGSLAGSGFAWVSGAAGGRVSARRAFAVRCGAGLAVLASALISAYALDLARETPVDTWADVESAVKVLNAAAPHDVNEAVTLERVSADEATRTMTYHMSGAVETLDDNIFDPVQMKERETADGCGAYRPYLAGIVEQLRFVYTARDGSKGVFTILPGDCGIAG